MRSPLANAVALMAPAMVAFGALTPIAQAWAPADGGSTEMLLLGTAAGPPLRAARSEPATLLTVDGHRYLIDCGIGTIRRLVEAGIPSETIETIFITHHHPDHDLGLADVMANDVFQLALSGQAHGIDVYGPAGTAAFVDAAFKYVVMPFRVLASEPSGFAKGVGGHEPRNPFTAHEIAGDGLVYQDARIKVTAAENTHFALMAPEFRSQFHSYSLRIETPHGVVVFTGDTGRSPAVVTLAKGADVFVSEVEDAAALAAQMKIIAERNHWPPDRVATMMPHMTEEHLDLGTVGEMATRAGVRAVLLDHYDPDDPAAYVTRVKKAFAGQVVAGADLQRYCVHGRAAGDGPALSACQ